MNINTDNIWTDPDRMCGRPCLRGRRIPVSHMLSHLMEMTLDEYCFEYDLDKDLCLGALVDLQKLLDKENE